MLTLTTWTGDFRSNNFRRCLKLIPKPKGAYNGTEKITICPGGHLHWGGAYIRNYTVVRTLVPRPLPDFGLVPTLCHRPEMVDSVST